MMLCVRGINIPAAPTGRLGYLVFNSRKYSKTRGLTLVSGFFNKNGMNQYSKSPKWYILERFPMIPFASRDAMELIIFGETTYPNQVSSAIAFIEQQNIAIAELFVA